MSKLIMLFFGARYRGKLYRREFFPRERPRAKLAQPKRKRKGR